MIETNNPDIDVNDLMDQVRAEAAKRRSNLCLKGTQLATEKTTSDIENFKILNIQALINNAENRSQSRTKWPDKLNKFPLNVSKKLQQLLLKLLNFFFKEQRVVNISLVQAGRESLELNRELIKQIVNLQAKINDTEVRLNNTEIYQQNINTRLDNIEVHGQNIDTRLDNIEVHGQNIDTRLNGIEQDRSYIKNELGQQKSQLNLFLETANQRLTESFSRVEMQKLTEENSHSVDAAYVAFEDRFRGSKLEIVERLKVYLPILSEAKVGTKDRPILDLGCGRGEWLNLLRESKYIARGLDINRIMVEQSTSQGLEAIESDAIQYLQSLSNDCLGAVTGFHIIEHLTLATLIELISQTVRVLKPGGLAIFETPNPKNLVVGACNFYSDPTHKNPVFPETIQFFLQYQGLVNVQLMYLNPVEDASFKQIDPKWDTLDNWFFGARDYAVIGHKI
jgi:O-antigen chain-terminating methyltransferase